MIDVTLMNCSTISWKNFGAGTCPILIAVSERVFFIANRYHSIFARRDLIGMSLFAYW